MVSSGTKRDKVKEVARNSKVVLTGELEMSQCGEITQKVSTLREKLTAFSFKAKSQHHNLDTQMRYFW